MSDISKSTRKTLVDTDIATRRGLGRRAFLLAGIGGAASLAGQSASAASDNDSSPGDPYGRGRTGLTDNDASHFNNGDREGHGIGAQRTGITDTDRGSLADPPRNGRGQGRYSDSDSGSNADPAGQGRRGG